jgi:hypothetical protein
MLGPLKLRATRVTPYSRAVVRFEMVYVRVLGL